MASRFQLLSEEDLKKLSESAENQNTKKSANNWVKVFTMGSWTVDQSKLGGDRAESLDEVLSQFFGEIRKQDGREYEPESLRVMQSSLHRYLSEKGYNKSILTDQVFKEYLEILEGRARFSWEQGMGKKKNASKAIDSGEEDILWNYQKLGDSSSTSLVRTIWSLCTQHFGLWGCQEHTTMRVENFVVLRDISGCEYVQFLDDPTKTRQSGLRPNQRATNPKMFLLEEKD